MSRTYKSILAVSKLNFAWRVAIITDGIEKTTTKSQTSVPSVPFIGI